MIEVFQGKLERENILPTLSQLTPGDTFRFWNSDDTDPYLVVDCQEYQLFVIRSGEYKSTTDNSVVVLNLATSQLRKLSEMRVCEEIDCELHL